MKFTRAAVLGSVMLVSAISLALSPGDSAPDFSAKNQDGKVIKLSDYRGKPVLVYFYPKDDTPGCTKEACRFRDAFTTYQKLGAVILGVSRQGQKSHQEFRSKYRIPFDLLVDEDGSIAKAMGVKTIPLIGLHKRQSLLIAPDGKVVRFYDDVNPDQHSEEVIKDIQGLRSQGGTGHS